MRITREQLTFEFLEALFEERERDPMPTHWVKREAIWERVTAKYGESLGSELANAAFNHLYADRLINQVGTEIQINEPGIAAYIQMKAGPRTVGDDSKNRQSPPKQGVTVEKQKAIEILEELRARGSTLRNPPGTGTPEFAAWRYAVEAAILHIFPDEPRHLDRIKAIAFTTTAYRSATRPGANERMFRSGVEQVSAILQSMVEEIRTYWKEPGASSASQPHPGDSPMKINHEQLQFEILDVLFNEHERGTAWVPLDLARERVSARCGGPLGSDLPIGAFMQLCAERLIDEMSGPDGEKLVQINAKGIAAYINMKVSRMTGVKGSPASADPTDGSPGPDPKAVFVVHGRNETARKSMFEFLRALRLNPLEWSEIVLATGKPAPYIGEVLDRGFAMAKAVVVLWTPDDEARLREEYRSPGDPPYEAQLMGQARPNVLFEAGMAMGLYPDRTVLVELGNLRPFTDVLGRHVIKLNNSFAPRQDLANRLKNAGCAVNLGGTDWHSAGTFDLKNLDRERPLGNKEPKSTVADKHLSRPSQAEAPEQEADMPRLDLSFHKINQTWLKVDAAHWLCRLSVKNGSRSKAAEGVKVKVRQVIPFKFPLNALPTFLTRKGQHGAKAAAVDKLGPFGDELFDFVEWDEHSNFGLRTTDTLARIFHS